MLNKRGSHLVGKLSALILVEPLVVSALRGLYWSPRWLRWLDRLDWLGRRSLGRWSLGQ